MKKILCPTDFSETADHAIAYAAKLCKKIGAELTLLNVQSIFSLSPQEVIKGKFLATEPASENLETQSYEVMKVFKIICHSEVAPSNKKLSDVISEKAKEYDLIIIGSNGADDYYEFFFGSRSYNLAKSSSIPVLIVPTGCGYQDISRMVYAFDYEHEHDLPLTQLTKFANILNAKITVLQVKDKYSRSAEIRARKIEERVTMLTTLHDIEFETLYSNEVSNSIHSYVVENNYDALTLCTIHHNFIEVVFHKSVIKSLSSIANYPVFIFHA